MFSDSIAGILQRILHGVGHILKTSFDLVEVLLQIFGNQFGTFLDLFQHILHPILEGKGQFLEHLDDVTDGGDHGLEPVPDVLNGLLYLLFHIASDLLQLLFELVDLLHDVLLQLAQQVLQQFLERTEIRYIGVDAVENVHDLRHQALHICHAFDGVQSLEVVHRIGEQVFHLFPTHNGDGDRVAEILGLLQLGTEGLGNHVGIMLEIGGVLDGTINGGLDGSKPRSDFNIGVHHVIVDHCQLQVDSARGSDTHARDFTGGLHGIGHGINNG